jgi:hypothetical protein
MGAGVERHPVGIFGRVAGKRAIINNPGATGCIKRFVLRSQVLGHAHKALMAAGVAVPPTFREKA